MKHDAKNTSVKHTPGPWAAKKQGLGFVIEEKCYNGFQIANTLSAEVTPDEANARLIAAAPELLAALTDLWNMINNAPFELSPEQADAFNRAGKALVKAEGNGDAK